MRLYKQFDAEYLVIPVQEEGKQVTFTCQQIQVPTKHKLDSSKLSSTQSVAHQKCRLICSRSKVCCTHK